MKRALLLTLLVGVAGRLAFRSSSGLRGAVERVAAGPAEPAPGDRTKAEWISLGFSSAVLLTLTGLLVYQHLVGGSSPPVIEVQPRPAEARQVGGLYYLPLEIVNRGDQTAQDVRVLLAPSPSPDAEPAEILIDYLAGGASASATAVFAEPPIEGDVLVKRLSFREP